MEGSEKNQPLSVDKLIELGFSEKEAKAIHKSQSYEPPTNIDELKDHAWAAKKQEEARRSDAWDERQLKESVDKKDK